MNYYEGQFLIYPEAPSKPTLSRNCTAAEALDYATKLADYEAEDEIYKKRKNAYKNLKNDRLNEFKADLFEEFGMTNHPNVEKFWTKAWDDGHASGLQCVYNEFSDLVDLIK